MSAPATPDYNWPASISGVDTLWVLLSSAGVFLMSPACGYFYSGTVEFKNAISLVLFAYIIYSVVMVQWYTIGFSLAFSDKSQNNFIGDFNLGALSKALDFTQPGHPNAATIPQMAFMFYQAMFAAVTPALAYGAVAERLKVFPFMVFVFFWSTFVYDVIAYWVWAPGGWLYRAGFGAQDFAGGGPVHIVAGCSGLALCLALGRRRNPNATPHSLPLMTIGTLFFWFGWLFFNGGSSLAMNGRAVVAMFNTNLAGAVGGITWILFDYRVHKKFTSLGFCSGAVAGLVAITPASGFVEPHYAIVIGILGSLGANMTCFLKSKLNYDDTLDTFPVHAIAGAVGLFLNGFFSTERVIFLDPRLVGATAGGGIDGRWILLGWQVAEIVAVAAWSFGVTYILAYGFMFVGKYWQPISLRVTEEEEMIGCDITLCGEVSYDFTNSGARLGEFGKP